MHLASEWINERTMICNLSFIICNGKHCGTERNSQSHTAIRRQCQNWNLGPSVNHHTRSTSPTAAALLEKLDRVASSHALGLHPPYWVERGESELGLTMELKLSFSSPVL